MNEQKMIGAETMADRYSRKISDIKDAIDNKIQEFLNNTDNKENKKQDIIRMIEYHRDDTDAVEERRNRVYENALTIIGAIVAALTIIVSFNTSNAPFAHFPWIMDALLCFLCAQFLVQFVTVILYYIQSSKKYPFNSNEVKEKYSNQWKWFYLGDEDIRSIPIKTSSSQKETDEAAKVYLCGLEKTFERLASESPDEELTSCIIQMYLLMVHNAYKNKYYLQLINCQKWGGVISLLLTAVFVYGKWLLLP